jgi:predicted Zn-dependent protease
MAHRVLTLLNQRWHNKLYLVALSLLLLTLGIGFIGVTHAQQAGYPESLVVTDDTAPTYRKLPEIESQLYGHPYTNQSLSQRLARIERTLFGTSMRAPAEVRMRQIEGSISEKNAQAQLANEEPMLAYLENKLFQRTYEGRPLPERVKNLEVQVFGRSFENYPTSVRLKKLTYAMPLVAKGVRLTKDDGIVIASTQRVTPRKTTNEAAPRVDTVQLDAGAPLRPRLQPNPLPASSPFSSGNYIQGIHRNSDGTTMRWKQLPIQVYLKPGPAENTVTLQAIAAWKTSFPVEIVSQSNRADIVVSWDAGDWAQNASGLLTRPVVHIDDRKTMRTVILINLYPLHGEALTYQLHATTHELGHAFGLWGHSTNPDDIMYPSLKVEVNDFPNQWAWRSQNDRYQPPVVTEDYQPSQRDINTLLKIYDLPATDLRSYTTSLH